MLSGFLQMGELRPFPSKPYNHVQLELRPRENQMAFPEERS